MVEIEGWEFEISEKDQKTLGDDLFAYWMALSFSVSELMVFHKLAIQSSEVEPKDVLFAKQAKTQTNTILRVFSAKLFEGIECVTGFEKIVVRKAKQGKASKFEIAFQEKFGESAEKFNSLRKEANFKTAKFVRDKATNHIRSSEVKRNLKHAFPGAERSMVFRRMPINSYFPIGEDMVFGALLDRHYHDEKRLEERQQAFREYLKWMLKTSSELAEYFSDVCFWIIIESLEHARPPESMRTLEEEYCVESGKKPLVLIVGD